MKSKKAQTKKRSNQKNLAVANSSATNLSKSAPLVSVITTVYNGKQYLSRAIESILNQTYQNLEIILVDDGSTDGSGDLCDELAENEPRLRVLHQQNAGLSAARNAGLKIAHGAYLTFVDSDDTIELGFIETLLRFMQEKQLPMVTCSFMEVTNGEKHKFNGFGRTSKQVDIYADALEKSTDGLLRQAPYYILSRASFLTHMLCDDSYTTSSCGKIYRADLFHKIAFPVGKLYEDMGTTYRLALQCDRIGFLDQGLYNYYQNTGSIIHQKFSEKKLDLIEMTDQACDAIDREVVQPILAQSQRTHSTVDYQQLAQAMILSDAISKRRMHARFSILRQLLSCRDKRCRQQHRELYHDLVEYIQEHRADILHNPLSSKRDVAATYILSSKIIRGLYGWMKRL